jgi:hypothetical protein
MVDGALRRGSMSRKGCIIEVVEENFHMNRYRNHGPFPNSRAGKREAVRLARKLAKNEPYVRTGYFTVVRRCPKMKQSNLVECSREHPEARVRCSRGINEG